MSTTRNEPSPLGEQAPRLDGAGLEVLDRPTCLRLLAATDRGRIAVTVGALPSILPVRFVLDVDRVVLCAGRGTVLDRATDDHVVAFQADGLDRPGGAPTPAGPDAEWSVTLVGLARHLVAPAEVARATTLDLPRWSEAGAPCFVAISVEQLAGRRMRR